MEYFTNIELLKYNEIGEQNVIQIINYFNRELKCFFQRSPDFCILLLDKYNDLQKIDNLLRDIPEEKIETPPQEKVEETPKKTKKVTKPAFIQSYSLDELNNLFCKMGINNLIPETIDVVMKNYEELDFYEQSDFEFAKDGNWDVVYYLTSHSDVHVRNQAKAFLLHEYKVTLEDQ